MPYVVVHLRAAKPGYGLGLGNVDNVEDNPTDYIFSYTEIPNTNKVVIPKWPIISSVYDLELESRKVAIESIEQQNFITEKLSKDLSDKVIEFSSSGFVFGSQELTICQSMMHKSKKKQMINQDKADTKISEIRIKIARMRMEILWKFLKIIIEKLFIKS